MKEMPKDLPPLPEGYVYLGRGGEFQVTLTSYKDPEFMGRYFRNGGWGGEDTKCEGWINEWHYAAPIGSEIAKINGYGEEAKVTQPTFTIRPPGVEIPAMSLRDWFAGQALSAMSLKDDGDYSSSDHDSGTPELEAEWKATYAYRIADAMLAAREKK